MTGRLRPENLGQSFIDEEIGVHAFVIASSYQRYAQVVLNHQAGELNAVDERYLR